MKVRYLNFIIVSMVIAAAAGVIVNCGTAAATLYNYSESDDYGIEGMPSPLNPSAGIYGDAGLPYKEAEDFYGIGILGFDLTPDDFGLLSWEVAYTGPEGEKIGPTRRHSRWTFKPTRQEGGAYISLAKKTGGGSTGGGYGSGGSGGGGGLDWSNFFTPPADNPNQPASGPGSGPEGASSNNPSPPNQRLIPEPGTFLALATGLLGLGGALCGTRRTRRRQG